MSLQDIFSKYNTNITVDIPPKIIMCFFGDPFFVDKLKSLNLKLQYCISPLHVGEYQTNIDLSVYLIEIDTNNNIGRFVITCSSKPDKPHIIFTSLTISIGDEDDEELKKYLKQGLSPLIMGVNFQMFYNIFQNENKNLIIDVDASGGFWKKIGMIETPEDADDDRSGYDKFVLLKNAYKWVFKKACETNWCLRSFHNLFLASGTAKGKKSKRKRSKRKRTKSRRSKRKMKRR